MISSPVIRATFAFSVELSQKFLNIFANFLRFGRWRITFNHFAILINQKLGEIPFDAFTT